MPQLEKKPLLISTRRRVAAALCLAVYLAAQQVRSTYTGKPSQNYWYFPQYPVHPDWLVAATNLFFLWVLIFYAFTLVAVFRKCRGGERVYLAAWLVSILLYPIMSLVNVPAATILEGVKAALMTIAFVAAVFIYRELQPAAKSPSESSLEG